MRISSEMFPFASHAELGYTLEFAKLELSAVGRIAMKYGHRLTMHPVACSPCCLMVGTIHTNRISQK
jgi:UV DNA damage repair endonuclease